MNNKANSILPFSVLMSIWSGGNAYFLDEALQSIAQSTVCPTEIILVKDGPLGDDLNQVIDKWQGKFKTRFDVVAMKNHGGLGLAMRIGSQHVSTHWIARMDADDICLPDRFEKELKTLISQPQLAVLGGQVDEFSADPYHTLRQRQVPVGMAQIVHFNKLRCPFNHPTVMINKDALMAVGGYQSFGIWEDYYLWERILAAGYQVNNLPDILVHMRVSNNLYQRRGNWDNIPYILRLQRYMYHHQLINRREFMGTTLVKIANAVAPVRLRKLVYQNYLRKQ